MHSQPPPKGSLEDLFRHHLLESEAAAVPPRPAVWEHIDNSLLLAQNEKYRRRLLVHRWGMAASLLLATLAGGGWWHSQQQATATLASANARTDAARRAVAGAVSPHPSGAATEAAVLNANATTAGATGQLAATGRPVVGGQLTGQPAAYRSLAPSHVGQPVAGTGLVASGQAGRAAGAQAYGAGASRALTFSSPNAYAIAATSTSPSAETATGLPFSYRTGSYASDEQPAPAGLSQTLTATEVNGRSGEAALATRLASLALAAPAGPPAELVAKELPPAPTQLRRWRYGAEYAITAFQPNIDFSRSGSDYNSALGLNTVSLTRAAAAEYRANLRPGLGQRLTLRATRWLGGHWSLGTGVEVAQQTAYSATSAAFTGQQVADPTSYSATPSVGSIAPPVSRELQESSFRYRSVGVPFELQYDNQAKAGVSFYGRIGAIVSALLSVRGEVAGNSEATRTYSAFSASSPYRRFTAILRGSAGVRYRPAGQGWGLNVGPTAEAGVQSLNAETDRSFLQQQRPYSVGLEAGFEFGGGLRPVPAKY
ncbi:MAG TPA: hypothetical protein VFO93_02470 [Hymenobacter sp.]|uniref:hypothetical protein n=1 Tax=Hymenobacter sp. TaxID=1898978 RepID=UPI002D80BCB4|nr:hypothetical protein [Hymenobacter sp.]HET9502378.1 hypothetical protein [Hymenobacter sp.]